MIKYLSALIRLLIVGSDKIVAARLFLFTAMETSVVKRQKFVRLFTKASAPKRQSYQTLDNLKLSLESFSM
jgi:hypothetical protein